MSSFTLDPSQIPAMTPPDGVTSNFVDPESRASATRIVICIALALMSLFLVLRVYSRLKTRGTFEVDDYFCFASAAGVIAYTGLTLSLLGDPLGPHQWNVPLTAITLRFVTISLVETCLYAVVAILVKSTLLVLYLRIFRPNKRARIMIWFGIAFIAAFYLSCIVTNLVNCIPVSQSLPGLTAEEWAYQAKHDRCAAPELTLTVVQGFVNAATDFYVLTIPITSVLELHLPQSRKYGVLAIFLTGLLACACSIASVYYRYVFWGKQDYTWDSPPVYALGQVTFHQACELDVGIICSCLPVTFATVKGLAQPGGWWTTVLKYVKTGYHRSGRSGSEGAPQPLKSLLSDSSRDGNSLPHNIPRGTMTGVRTFIRKAYRSEPADSINVTTELRTFTELGSFDESYHAQLQQAYFEGSHNNLANPSQASFATAQKEPGNKG